MKKENVIIGTLILSASSIFVRMIGFIFRVWLAGAMGAEGIGVYMLIMSLFGVCSTLATSGISGGVAKLAAGEFGMERGANARRILGRALTLSLGISLTVGALLFVFAEPVALYILRDARTELSLRFLAPGLPLMAISSCMRGYFIAQRRVLNPAASQVLEQLIKMAFIMAMIGYWMPKGIEYGCAVVILGITIGEVVCFLVSLSGYVADLRGARTGRANIRGVTKSLLAFAIPVSAGSYVRSILRLVEDVLVLSGLRKFSGQDAEATSTYGVLKGMVMPLLIFPLSLLSALVITLTPEISRMHSTENKARLERTISRILQFTSIMGIFIVCVFISFGYELGIVVYKSAEAGEMLRQLSWLCPFMCVETVVVSILQGMGEQVSSLRYNLADCLLRVAMVYALVPRWGSSGFLLMVVVSNVFTSVLNLRRLLKITRLRLRFADWVLRPVLAATASCQIVRVICNFYLFEAMPMWAGMLAGIVIIAATYVAVLLMLGAITADDFDWVLQNLRISKKAFGTDAEKSLL